MFTIRYGKTIASCAAFATVALLLTLVLTHTGPAKPRSEPRPEVTEVSTGIYTTAINIHNPSQIYPVELYEKAVLDGSAPTLFTASRLAPDYAVELNCTTIGELYSPARTFTSFSKGFVVIFANGPLPQVAAAQPLPLDVVGVYSAEPPSVTLSNPSGGTQTEIPGIALQMLTILPRLEEAATTAAGTSAAGELPAGQYYEYAAKFLCGNTATVTSD